MKHDLNITMHDTTVAQNEEAHVIADIYGYCANDTDQPQDAIFELTLRAREHQPITRTFGFSVPAGSTALLANELGTALTVDFRLPPYAWPGGHTLHAQLALITSTGDAANEQAQATLRVRPTADNAVTSIAPEALEEAQQRCRKATAERSINELKEHSRRTASRLIRPTLL